MKKISSWFIAIATVAFAFTSTAFGFEKSLPIGTRARLVSHALLEVRQVNGSLWAQGNLRPTNGPGYFNREYNSPTPSKSELIKLISSQPLAYRVLNPTNDWLSFYTTCSSAEGFNLFSGGSGFKLEYIKGEYGKGGWGVPELARRFDMMLAYEIPLRLKNAYAARIIPQADNGNQKNPVYLHVYYSEKTGIGTVMFRSEYAGTLGVTVISYWELQPDGNMGTTEVTYNLSGDGEEVATENGVLTVNPGMSDIVTLNVPYAYMTNIPSSDHIGTVPLGELRVPVKMWVYLHASTREGDIATKVSYLKIGEAGGEWQEIEIPAGGPPYVPVLLEHGLYHIDYNIPGLRPPTPYEPQPVNGGGEKG